MTTFSKKEKAEHVKRARQTRLHTCHWPGCKAQVKPAMWGCRAHWFKLPKHLRDIVWEAYRPGQEEDLNPSGKYLKAVQEVQEWIESLGRPAKTEPMQPCPMDHCDRLIDYGDFCCPGCWFWVPDDLKFKISAALSFRMSADRFPLDWPGIRKAALDAVNTEMKKRGEA